jgi:signal transduction histidine kinase
VRISVADNGIGIDADMLERIFEPFVQQRKDVGVGSGLGIGLSLTKRLVELHDGQIWAESAGKGTGSEFVVVLPVVSEEAAQAAPTSAAEYVHLRNLRLRGDGAGS